MNDIIIKKVDSPFIFSFPHSGEMLTHEMEWQLKPEAVKFLPNVDWYLPELYGFLKKYKASLISTPHSRYVVDVNRPPDTQIFGNYRRSLVYETNTWDEEIYQLPPTQKELERRIKRYYDPYHEELEKLVGEMVAKFGKVYLIDIHSFMGLVEEDVCLGNRHNSTCSELFFETCCEAFESEGFKIAKNKVFIGGYITKSYAIQEMVETLQIELRYSNYIEAHELDQRHAPSKSSSPFYETSYRLERVFEKIGVEKREQDKVRSVVEEGKGWYRKLALLLLVIALILAFFDK